MTEPRPTPVHAVADGGTPLDDVVEVHRRLVNEPGRKAKVAALAELLAGLGTDEVVVVVAFLVGEPRQGRIGIGWRTVAAVEPPPADQPALTVAETDAALEVLAGLSGQGSVADRRHTLADLLGRATAAEAVFIRRLLTGELRQGAKSGLMAEAIAAAAGVPPSAVRRANMLGGNLGPVAAIALSEGSGGLASVGLEVGRPIQPMLASSAPSVADAVAEMTGTGDGERVVVVEWKLDGVRVQVHRDSEAVAIFTRNLNDVTDRLPGVVAAVRALRAERLVLDGEVVGTGDDDRPGAFQDTMARFGTEASDLLGAPPGAELAAWWFDLVHRDGRDLLDEPLEVRRRELGEVVGEARIPGVVTADAAEAEAFLAEALERGHEGVMVKDPTSSYAAGRRGKAWRKVKPVHTVDLVVLAAEWGSGRRRGWLSNLHLGARDPGGGPPVMVGKTFKGLTDELLGWQTEALLARETARDGHVVHVVPELVVEIAIDGVQRSTRYPGGVALRFARVVGYRPDKGLGGVDTLAALVALGGH